MQKSDPTLSNVSNKPEFSQSSFSNLIIVCVYWYKPTKNSFANKNLAFSVCVMFNKTIHSNTTERDNPFSIPFSFWLGISWLGSFYEKNNESLLVLKKCRQGNKRRWRLWEQLDNLLSIHDGYDSLIIQDAQQCNGSRLVVTLSVPRNRGSQLDAPVTKSSCWTAPKRKVMVVSVADIFMRQVKLMELLSSPGPSAKFQKKLMGHTSSVGAWSTRAAKWGW